MNLNKYAVIYGVEWQERTHSRRIGNEKEKNQTHIERLSLI